MLPASRELNATGAQSSHGVYPRVNTLHKLVGRRLSHETPPEGRAHIPLPRRARRRRNYVTGQTMGPLFTKITSSVFYLPRGSRSVPELTV